MRVDGRGAAQLVVPAGRRMASAELQHVLEGMALWLQKTLNRLLGAHATAPLPVEMPELPASISLPLQGMVWQVYTWRREGRVSLKAEIFEAGAPRSIPLPQLGEVSDSSTVTRLARDRALDDQLSFPTILASMPASTPPLHGSVPISTSSKQAKTDNAYLLYGHDGEVQQQAVAHCQSPLRAVADAGGQYFEKTTRRDPTQAHVSVHEKLCSPTSMLLAASPPAGGRLILTGPVDEPSFIPAACALLQRWLQRAADGALERRLLWWAERLEIPVGRVTVRSQRSRWGSCSSRGDISLNCVLLLLPVALVDHVCLHELCHRRHMDHSPRFRDFLARVAPHWALREHELDRAWRHLPGWAVWREE